MSQLCGHRLSKYVGNRDNNFNLIRFTAALMVIFSHSYAISLGDGSFEPFRHICGIPLGHIAVDIFFVTSGFLITSSFLRSETIAKYFWARILRIYPALIVAMLFCAIVIGGWFTLLSFEEYFSQGDVAKFILLNSSLLFGLSAHLPGVFSELPYPSAVNGSLWTLPWEVRMYLLVAMAGVMAHIIQRASRDKIFSGLVTIIFVAALTLQISNNLYEFTSNRHLVNAFRLTTMFFMGAQMYMLRDKISLDFRLFMFTISMLVLMAFLGALEAFYYFYVASIGYITLYLAYVPAGVVRKFSKAGDYSYGLYIYAFPVQQAVVAISIPFSVAVTPLALFYISSLITLGFAMLSWHFVEKRALQYKDFQIWSGKSEKIS